MDISNIYDAKEVLKDVISKTPLVHADKLHENLWIKAENLQGTGAFKLRGAYHKLHSLTQKEREKGVIAASAGNHAQGVAYSCMKMGIKGTIVMPKTAPLSKIEATRSYGVAVELQGDTFNDAYEYAKNLQEITGAVFVEPFDDEYVIAGVSPELLLKGRGRSIMTMPIAGTRPRGADEQEDLKAARSLLEDPKENAEHSMLVDLGRNDIGRVSDIGSVQVRHMKQVQRYSHVMHMTSEVHGRLKESCDIYDALASVLPAGTLSGAPKISAMNIIEQLEPVKREIYGGAIGFLGYNKQFDACITIRTFIFHNHKVYLQAGAGIVKDSVPEKEYEETLHKAKAMLRAVHGEVTV